MTLGAALHVYCSGAVPAALWAAAQRRGLYILSAAALLALYVAFWLGPMATASAGLAAQIRVVSDLHGYAGVLRLAALVQMLAALFIAGPVVAQVQGVLAKSEVLAALVIRTRDWQLAARVALLLGLAQALIIDLLFAPLLWAPFAAALSAADLVRLSVFKLGTLALLMSLGSLVVAWRFRAAAFRYHAAALWAGVVIYYLGLLGVAWRVQYELAHVQNAVLFPLLQNWLRLTDSGYVWLLAVIVAFLLVIAVRGGGYVIGRALHQTGAAVD